MKTEHSIFINKNADDVFNFLKDLKNHQKFVEAIKSVDTISDGDIKEGAKYKVHAGMMGKEVTLDYEITSLQKPSFISAKADSSLIKNLTQKYFITEEGEGTNVKLEFEGNPGGLGGMFSGLIKTQVNSQIKKDLNRLKEYLEKN